MKNVGIKWENDNEGNVGFIKQEGAESFATPKLSLKPVSVKNRRIMFW
jgi:hypothetical protein